MEEFGRGLDGPQICSFWFSWGFTTIGIMFVSCFKIRTSWFGNHRRQGHTPHHPAGSECAREHSTFQHRRRTAKGLSTEFQADFCWLKREGEVLDHMENQENLKILVVVDLATNNVGYIVIGEDKNAIYSQINQYLQQCGISSTSTSVLIHTDAERAVGELFTKSGSQFSFAVRRSNPQQHQSTGGAERCVRRLKESLSIFRADLSKCGVDIKFAHEPVQTALTYLSVCHNHFSKTPGTDLSPLENACGRRLSKPTSSLFVQLSWLSYQIQWNRGFQTKRDWLKQPFYTVGHLMDQLCKGRYVWMGFLPWFGLQLGMLKGFGFVQWVFVSDWRVPRTETDCSSRVWTSGRNKTTWRWGWAVFGKRIHEIIFKATGFIRSCGSCTEIQFKWGHGEASCVTRFTEGSAFFICGEFQSFSENQTLSCLRKWDGCTWQSTQCWV